MMHKRTRRKKMSKRFDVLWATDGLDILVFSVNFQFS